MAYIGPVQVKLRSLSSPLRSVSIYQSTESPADTRLDIVHVLQARVCTSPKDTLIRVVFANDEESFLEILVIRVHRLSLRTTRGSIRRKKKRRIVEDADVSV